MPVSSHEGEFFLENNVPTLIFTLLGDQHDGNVGFTFTADYPGSETPPIIISGNLTFCGDNKKPAYKKVDPWPDRVFFEPQFEFDVAGDGRVGHPVLKFPLAHASRITGCFLRQFDSDNDKDIMHFIIADAQKESSIELMGATLTWTPIGCAIQTNDIHYVALIYGYETPEPLLNMSNLDPGRRLLTRYYNVVSVTSESPVPSGKDEVSGATLRINLDKFYVLQMKEEPNNRPKCTPAESNLWFSPVTYRNRPESPAPIHMVQSPEVGQPNGSQITVGSEALKMGFYIIAEKCSETAQLTNINTATKEELIALPGIGPVKASTIIAERKKQVFCNIDELLRVNGIGPAILANLRDLITV